jgi:RES domain-containing protein
MIVYRLIRKKYGYALSGEGARLAGGRWNSPGLPLIYTSESRSLCTVEVAVSLPIGLLPDGFEMLLIEIPDEIVVLDIHTDNLPVDWNKPDYSEETKRIGDQFIDDNRYAVLKVPSAVIPGDFNYLINPGHKDFDKIKVIKQEPYELDGRFFNR